MRSPPTRRPPPTARRPPPGDSSTSSAACTSAAASGSSPSATTRTRSRSAPRRPPCNATAAGVAWRRGQLAQARALGFEALRLAQASDATAAAALANNILGLLGCGRDYLQRSLRLASECANPGIRIAALNNLARDHASGGELARAEELLREALAQCALEGDLHHEAALRNNLADVLHRSGRREAAMEELKRAVSAFAAVGGEDDEFLYPGIWSLAEW